MNFFLRLWITCCIKFRGESETSAFHFNLTSFISNIGLQVIVAFTLHFNQAVDLIIGYFLFSASFSCMLAALIISAIVDYCYYCYTEFSLSLSLYLLLFLSFVVCLYNLWILCDAVCMCVCVSPILVLSADWCVQQTAHNILDVDCNHLKNNETIFIYLSHLFRLLQMGSIRWVKIYRQLRNRFEQGMKIAFLWRPFFTLNLYFFFQHLKFPPVFDHFVS